ncbi:hypothetical protein ACFP8W_08030, partial [Nocardioides hankookensis]
MGRAKARRRPRPQQRRAATSVARLAWIGILTASAAQVAVIATQDLDLLWVMIGADLAVGLVLALGAG